MTFSQPIWLLLAIPLALLLRTYPMPSRMLAVLRIAMLALLLLAVAGLSIRLPRREGTVVVVADRSASMPPDAAARQREIIAHLASSKPPGSRLALVSCAARAMVESTPQGGNANVFTTDVNPDGSDLSAGLAQALALIPKDAPGRIVMLSDGRWTGHNPLEIAPRCSAACVAIDYRAQERLATDDLAIQRIAAPIAVVADESFLLTAWLNVPSPQRVKYELMCGQTVVGSGAIDAVRGFNRLVFRDRADKPGSRRYTLRITGTIDDPVLENNTAHLLVGVRGARPILCVSEKPSGLAKLLVAGGLDIVARTPEQCTWSLDELAGYTALVVENVPASSIGTHGMSRIASWVTHTGGGLLMTGGKRCYAPGGYFRSPLEPIMPVSMELRTEHRKFSLAVMVALDRSGSMGVTVGGGMTKIDLANIGTVQVLDLLNDRDELGVIAVDNKPYTVVDMGSVENARSKRGKILSIRAEDYGIFIYEALATSSRMLAQAKASNRHIILFADAAHSIEPGDYRNLLAKCASANITISTIGLGAKTDVDAQLLMDIAKRGGGESYFTADPNEIPRLFAQDTFTATRSAFVEDATKAALLAPYASLGGTLRTDMPALGGYNLCYLKPEASLAAVSQDENAAPLVASWHRGNGRVLCYTGEADGTFTGAMASWPAIGEFFSTLARWTAGYANALPASMMAVSERRDGLYRVELHLDPARTKDPFDVLPDVRVLRGIPGQLPLDEIHPLRWATADMLAAEIPLAGAETVIAAVSVPGLAPAMLAPVCLPYSPEFQPPEQGKGRETLERLAAATGGKPCADMADVWRSLPKTPRRADLSLWLYLTAVLLLVLEVLERRTGWISRAAALVGLSLRCFWYIVSDATARWRSSIRITPHTTSVSTAKAKDIAKPAAVTKSSEPITPQASPDADRDAVHEAMQRARDRARRLTRK